jgi:alpha-ketoglutarate-dependent taurine dioxygenase
VAFNGGSSAVLLPRLGLAGVEVDQRRQAVFALAVLLGDVTANLPFEQVVWDVKDRMDDRPERIKFSESARSAFYHTDNGTLPVPENYFLLYAVRAAECGGGVSLIRDIRTVKAQLAQTPHGRAAIRTLTDTDIPKQIPAKLWKYADVSPDGCQYTPIFAERPLVRWRRGGIRRALDAHPECATPAVRQALELLIDQLKNGDGEQRLLIPTDGLLIIDNHTALHGRTAFTDPQRHLLRLRLHPPA